MAAWLALLRGVNVGGGSTLPMAELRTLMAGAGCADVRTYVQSGNAVLTAETDDREALAARIAAAVEKGRGFRPVVMLLTPAELAAAVHDNPFPEATRAPTTLHLLFLATTPERPDLAAVEAVAAQGTERFALRGRVLYLWCPDGIGRSKLAVAAGRAIRPVEATARNWRTVAKLNALLAEAGGAEGQRS